MPPSKKTTKRASTRSPTKATKKRTSTRKARTPTRKTVKRTTAKRVRTPTTKKTKKASPQKTITRKTPLKRRSTRMHPDEAKYYLRSIEDSQAFWINNGPIVKNVEDLHGALNDIDQNTFRHHVGSDHNDFHIWITEVVGDQELAKNFGKRKAKMLSSLKARIRALRKASSS